MDDSLKFVSMADGMVSNALAKIVLVDGVSKNGVTTVFVIILCISPYKSCRPYS